MNNGVKQGGASHFICSLTIKILGASSQQLADYLLNNAGVATLAGSDFGNFSEGYLRLSYANSLESIRVLRKH
jgi:aspartate aminotransferase